MTICASHPVETRHERASRAMAPVSARDRMHSASIAEIPRSTRSGRSGTNRLTRESGHSCKGGPPAVELENPMGEVVRLIPAHGGFHHAPRRWQSACPARAGSRPYKPLANKDFAIVEAGVAISLQTMAGQERIPSECTLAWRVYDSTLYSRGRIMQTGQTYLAPAPVTRVRDLVGLIRAEYDEMPGLCLTRAQAQRLWRLEADVCDNVLGAMVDAGFLRLTSFGYMRG
jgi:hypothetical protein